MVERLRAGRPGTNAWQEVFISAERSGAASIDTFCSVTNRKLKESVRDASRFVQVPVTLHGM